MMYVIQLKGIIKPNVNLYLLQVHTKDLRNKKQKFKSSWYVCSNGRESLDKNNNDGFQSRLQPNDSSIVNLITGPIHLNSWHRSHKVTDLLTCYFRHR